MRRLTGTVAVVVFLSALAGFPRPATAHADAPVDHTLLTRGAPAEILIAPRFGGLHTFQAAPSMALLDDFSRRDGPIGGYWTTVNSTFRIVDEEVFGGTHSDTSGIALFSGATGDVVEGDVAIRGSGVDYTGFVLNYGSGANNLFIKVQDNEGGGTFDSVGCYLGNNVNGFGRGFFFLTNTFRSAHMRVEVSRERVVTITFSGIDGGNLSQAYTCPNAPVAEGIYVGIIGYQGSSAALDNFAASTDGLVEGYVFIDKNGDGQRNSGEDTGLAEARVKLSSDDVVVRETVSGGPDGHYVFADLIPGYYCVEVLLPSEYIRTTPRVRCANAIGGPTISVDFGVRRGIHIHCPSILRQ